MIDDSEALITLSKAILQMQKDVKALHTLFIDNITFIKGMGDVPTQMSKVLMDIVDNHEKSTKLALQQLIGSTEFFKNTVSQKYPDFNIMQEWFTDFTIKVMDIFTELGEDYLFSWTKIKIQDYLRKYAGGKVTAEMDYDERCAFGEYIFEKSVTELGADPMCKYILRTLYIPYVSLYYLKPLTDYPYLEEWLGDIEKYNVMKKVREKMMGLSPSYTAYHETLVQNIADEVSETKGLKEVDDTDNV